MLSWLVGCPECGAAQGDPHWPGCRADRTVAESFELETALLECRRRGWSVAYVAGEGFRPCRPDEEGAYADLDRYVYWVTGSTNDSRTV